MPKCVGKADLRGSRLQAHQKKKALADDDFVCADIPQNVAHLLVQQVNV